MERGFFGHISRNHGSYILSFLCRGRRWGHGTWNCLPGGFSWELSVSAWVLPGVCSPMIKPLILLEMWLSRQQH